jgi:hypothetical protein
MTNYYRICKTNRRATFNFQTDRDSLSPSSNRIDSLPNESDYGKDKEIDSLIFGNSYKGKRLQLVDKLDIGKDSEYSDSNIVNGLDDVNYCSIQNDKTLSNYDDKYETLTTHDKKKSRNLVGLHKKFKSKGIKTMLNMKENIPSNSSTFTFLNCLDITSQNNSSFAANQNHLHLHVNVTNSDFR